MRFSAVALGGQVRFPADPGAVHPRSGGGGVRVGLGEAAGLAGACCWGVTSLMIRRAAGQSDLVRLNTAMLAVAALLVGSAVLVLAALGVRPLMLAADAWAGLAYLAVAAVLNFAVGNSAYFQALGRLGVARAMPITLVQPLVAALLAAALLGERLTLGLGVGVVLIPAGVYLVAVPAGGGGGAVRLDRLGLALALAAPLAWALGAVALRPALARIDPLTATALRAAMGAAILATLGWLGSRGRTRWPRPRPVLLIGVPFSASTLLFTMSVAVVGAARGTALAATAPLFALPLAALWLGERVTSRTVIGTLLTVAGVVLVVGA